MGSSTALLIVDVQFGFINKHTSGVPKKVQQLQYEYETVYATQFHNTEGSFFRELIKWDRMQKDTRDFELAFELKQGAKRIEKTIYSCVTSNFIDDLRKPGRSEVHVCGIETDICVTKCAVDLFENGIIPIVLSEYCASKSGSESHRRALRTLARFIGTKQVKTA